MTFRVRLLVASMATVVVGLGALVVTGNVLLSNRVRSEASSILRANADSQISALDVNSTGVSVRPTANDDVLDHRGWVLSGGRVIERPERLKADLDRQAIALGRAGHAAEES